MVKPKEKTIRDVIPSKGIEMEYRKALMTLIAEMQHSVSYWLEAEYKKFIPKIVEDESPTHGLEQKVRKVMRQWTKKFNAMSKDIAKKFTKHIDKHASINMKNAFKEAGFTVRAKNTYAINDVLQSITLENVNLIKSIPQKYFTEVNGLVLRSIREGRGLNFLYKELHKRYDITSRRAHMIARDQTNKATESIVLERNKSFGIEEGVWIHRGGTRHPRPTHEAMSGKSFNLKEGMWDTAVSQYVFPGSLVNCRCTFKPIVPELRA